MLELKDITIKYGDFIAVNNINLYVKKGEFISVLGKSGCGKTTLLRGISGFEKIHSGNIVFMGKDITKSLPEDRNIGIIFQNYTLFINMNVYENIAFGLRVKKVDNEKINKEVFNIAKLLKIDDLLYKMPYELSGGQQQRIVIARSLVVKPTILLLDEPFCNLDKDLKSELIRELKNINTKLGTTMIYVSHDQTEILNISDKIIIMNLGIVEQIGDPKEIYFNPKTSYVANFIGNNNILSDDIMKYIKKKFNFSYEKKTKYFIRAEKINSSFLDFETKEAIVLNAIVKNINFLGMYNEIEVEVKGSTLKLIDYKMELKYIIDNKINICFNTKDIISVKEDNEQEK